MAHKSPVRVVSSRLEADWKRQRKLLRKVSLQAQRLVSMAALREPFSNSFVLASNQCHCNAQFYRSSLKQPAREGKNEVGGVKDLTSTATS